jgi:hypothetical protein
MRFDPTGNGPKQIPQPGSPESGEPQDQWRNHASARLDATELGHLSPGFATPAAGALQRLRIEFSQRSQERDGGEAPILVECALVCETLLDLIHDGVMLTSAQSFWVGRAIEQYVRELPQPGPEDPLLSTGLHARVALTIATYLNSCQRHRG